MPSRAPLRSSGFALVARGLRATGRIVGVLVIARCFTMHDVADFALAFAVASIVGLASDLGLTDHTVRIIAGATGETGAFERRIVALRLATLIAALPVAWLISRALGVSDLAALGTSSYVLAGSAIETYASIRRGHRRHDLEAAECAPLLVAVGAGAAIAFADGSLWSFYLTLGGSSIAFAIARGAMMLGRRGGDDASVRTLIADSRWMLARSVTTLALSELPVLLLDHLASERDVALYAVAARPVGVMMQLLAVLPLVYLPLLSRAAAVSEARLRERTSELNLLHAVATPAAFAACVVGGELLLSLSGASYEGGRTVLVVLSLGTLVYASTLSTLPLIVLRRERAVVVAALVGVAGLVAASVVLVPDRGAVGVALAACVAYSAVKVVLVLAYRATNIPLGDRRLAGAIAAVAVVLTAGSLAPQPAAEIVMIASGVASAIATLLLLRAAPAD